MGAHPGPGRSNRKEETSYLVYGLRFADGAAGGQIITAPVA